MISHGVVITHHTSHTTHITHITTSHITPWTSHLYEAGIGHAAFSLNQARAQSPSAKRRDALGESNEGSPAS